MASTVKLIYFSWVRERVGLSDEKRFSTRSRKTVSELLQWLQTRGEEFAAALEFPDIIRVALNQEHVEHDEPIGDASEIALFPPMTGG